MKHSYCAKCTHGVVTQEKAETGKQDPETRAFCQKSLSDLKREIEFCSQFQSPLNRLHQIDLSPEPVIIRSNDQVHKAAAELMSTFLHVATEYAARSHVASTRRRRR